MCQYSIEHWIYSLESQFNLSLSFCYDVALSSLGVDEVWIAREMLAFDVEVDKVAIHLFRP